MVNELLKAPWLPKLTVLRLPLSPQAMTAFEKFPQPNSLRTLILLTPASIPIVSRVLSSPGFARLNLLGLPDRRGPEVWSALLESGGLADSVRWDVSSSADLTVLIRDRLPRLRFLEMSYQVTPEDLQRLGNAPASEGLQVLRLFEPHLKDGHIEALLAARHLKGLKFLLMTGEDHPWYREAEQRLRERFGNAVYVA
jgi:hypothetical protein